MTKQTKIPIGLMSALKNNNKHRIILAGLLAGAAIGAVVALVIASDKNDELKQKASDWFCGLLDGSKDKISGITDAVKDKIANVKMNS